MKRLFYEDVSYLVDYIQTPHCETTSFQGYIVNELAGAIYLMKKHSHCRMCMSFDKPPKKNMENLEKFSIVWNVKKKRLQIPPRFDESFLQCLQIPGIRFVFGFICCLCKTEDHANCFLYDCKNQCFELFDPNGVTDFILPQDLFNHVQNYFKKLGVKHFFHCNEICPNDSFQTLQALENEETIERGDPFGFCLAWCLWYLDFCFSNSDFNTSRKNLVQIALAKFQNNRYNQSMTTFIRNYSQFIVRERNNNVSMALHDKSMTKGEEMSRVWELYVKYYFTKKRSKAFRRTLFRRKKAMTVKYGATFEFYIVSTLYEMLRVDLKKIFYQ